jgi:hypothetical protein
LSLLLLLDDEELVWDDEETSPTIVSEKVPPQAMAGNEGNQGEKEPDELPDEPEEVEVKAEVVGGNTEAGNVVVCIGKKVVPGWSTVPGWNVVPVFAGWGISSGA